MTGDLLVCVVMAGVLDASHIGAEANLGGIDIGTVIGVVHRIGGTSIETAEAAPYAYGRLAVDTLVTLTRIKGE